MGLNQNQNENIENNLNTAGLVDPCDVSGKALLDSDTKSSEKTIDYIDESKLYLSNEAVLYIVTHLLKLGKKTFKEMYGTTRPETINQKFVGKYSNADIKKIDDMIESKIIKYNKDKIEKFDKNLEKDFLSNFMDFGEGVYYYKVDGNRGSFTPGKDALTPGVEFGIAIKQFRQTHKELKIISIIADVTKRNSNSTDTMGYTIITEPK